MEPGFYDRFYEAIETSRVHSLFCESVFGIDLSQHGFTDLRQLQLLAERAGIRPEHSVLDLGCGNGKITEYLHDLTGARFTGLDSSAPAIVHARRRTRTKGARLVFGEGDIDDLSLPAAAYDAVLSIDTIYFSTDCDLTISRIRQSLKPDGLLLVFYSIGPALLGTWSFPKALLEPDRTPLADVLSRRRFAIEHDDLTAWERELAERRKSFLEGHKEDFDRDGTGFIYENRMGDAVEFLAAMEAGLHRRYLYRARRGDREPGGT